MTSPCSVPDWLRILFPMETSRQQEGCRRHDDRYDRGGDRRARLVTDLCFALDEMGCPPELLEQVMAHTAWIVPPGSMDADTAERYFWGVRMYGGSHWRDGDGPGTLPPLPPERSEAP